MSSTVNGGVPMKNVLAGYCLWLAASPALAADWPQWRYDAGRTAASPEELPAQLHLRWVRQYAPRVQTWDDPLNNDKMTYDRVFEPIVLNRRLIVGFNDCDKVVALDVDSGAEVWTYYTDGPVRLAPAGWRGKVYVASDDGCLHCLAADTGKPQWKFRGGPSAHKVLGNRRVISMWPARGGPVVRDGRVYFAAGIWPFLGVFVYALDAETGEVVWVNDSTGAHYSLQPHGSAAFGSVAPQGALVAAQDVLLVPGGRSLPAAFDRKTGKFLYFHNSGIVGGKDTGGSFVCGDDQRWFVHTRKRGTSAFGLHKGNDLRLRLQGEPVLAGAQFYAFGGRGTAAVRPVVEAVGSQSWELEVDASGDLIQAGRRLYAAGKNAIHDVDPAADEGKAKVAWSMAVDGQVLRLLAAEGKLFAVTLDGRILAFGSDRRKAAAAAPPPAPVPVNVAAARTIKEILGRSEANEGYALVFGVDDGLLLDALLTQSRLQVVAVDPDRARIDQLRRRFDRANLYGTRITLHEGDPLTFKAPSYVANLVIVGQAHAPSLAKPQVLEELYRTVRPYGGALWLSAAGAEAGALKRLLASRKLPQAECTPVLDGQLVVRQGPLPGSADWTHLYGDIGNTSKSNDDLVKLPLGVLWFGGNSHLDTTLNPVAPPEQVVGGRLFVQGTDCFSARDVYTGRVLWRIKLTDDDLAGFGIKPSPQPQRSVARSTDDPFAVGKVMDGQQCNTLGANFVAAGRWVYLARGNSCRVLDAPTGKLEKVLQLPCLEGQNEPPPWGFLGVYDDVLLGGWGHATGADEGKNGQAPVPDPSRSAGLVAFDRQSGKVLWKTRARHGFFHNGNVAGNGRVYCLDRPSRSEEERLARRGQAAPAGQRLLALNARTGAVIWETTDDVFGTWLSYAAKQDVLLQAVDHGPARIERTKPGLGIIAYAGKDGSVRWKKRDLAYFGPLIVHDETILTTPHFYSTSSGAFQLADGAQVLVANPLTGTREPWRISRGYGCNSLRAGQHLLTYRSGCAAYYDLQAKTGTASLGGFRSGCTSNLLIANGVLNAPDFTRHCTCSFQNQTSLALIHMPDLPMESWSCNYGPLNRNDFLAYSPLRVNDPVERVGINFGAPGDRRADNGTLWLEYPAVGGSSFTAPVAVKGDKPDALRRHEGFIQGALPWVTASCLRNLTEVAIDLGKASRTRTCTVRLYFAELEPVKAGQRVFDVTIQGKEVLKDLDIFQAAGGVNRGIVREYPRVPVSGILRIGFTPHANRLMPVLNGVEVIADRD